MVNAKVLSTFQGKCTVPAVKFSPDGKRVASCGTDGTLTVWDLETSTPTVLSGAHTSGISDICWSPNGHEIITASDDRTLFRWSVKESKVFGCLKGHSSFVFCCAISPSGGLLASGSFDESVRLWDFRKGGEALKVIAAHSDPVTGISFCPDGSMFASSSFDGLIRLWDVDSGSCCKTIVGDANPPLGGVAYSPNGKYLLSSALDSTLYMWKADVSDRSIAVKMYKEHVATKLCTTPSIMSLGELQAVVTPSEDGSIVVYNLNSQEVELSFPLERERITGFHSSGQLITCSQGSSITTLAIE